MSDGWKVECWRDAPMRTRAWFASRDEAVEYGAAKFGDALCVTRAENTEAAVERAKDALRDDLRLARVAVQDAEESARAYRQRAVAAEDELKQAKDDLRAERAKFLALKDILADAANGNVEVTP